MSASLLELVESTVLGRAEIEARQKHIHAAALATAQHFGGANFLHIRSNDVRRLFDMYDAAFFGGKLRDALGTAPLEFALSKRMTSAGGRLVYYRNRVEPARRRYEIGISTALLFQCFAGNDHRPITASGIVCHDRLSALQRILEHEIVHLAETLLWDRSSCSAARFQSIAGRFFGHTEHKHKLITPRERAMHQFGILPGRRVRFRCEGVEHTGVVNRINKRATVLVEDSQGQPYSNGKRYAKFYVPLRLLEAAE